MNLVDRRFDHPSEFPPAVSEWWQGQKQILFQKITISGCEDVRSILHQCQQLRPPKHHRDSVDRLSMQQILRRLMQIQLDHLGQNNCRIANMAWAGYVHSRFDGQSMPVVCVSCGEGQYAQKNPTFSVNRPNHFVTVQRKCPTCDQSTTRVLESGHIPFVWYGHCLKAPGSVTVHGDSYVSMLLPTERRTAL